MNILESMKKNIMIGAVVGFALSTLANPSVFHPKNLRANSAASGGGSGAGGPPPSGVQVWGFILTPSSNTTTKANGLHVITISTNGIKRVLGSSMPIPRNAGLAKSTTMPLAESGAAGGGTVPLSTIPSAIVVSNVPAPGGTPAAKSPLWLGVSVDPLPDMVRAQMPTDDGVGVIVRHVVDNSPAAKAGIKENDILLRLDNQDLFNSDQLYGIINGRKEGAFVHVMVMRKGKTSTITASLEAKTMPSATEVYDLGGWNGNPNVILNAPQNTTPVVLQSQRSETPASAPGDIQDVDVQEVIHALQDAAIIPASKIEAGTK